MPAALTKVCGHCGKTKPLSDFYHNSRKSDYHNGICAKRQLEVNKQNKK